MIDDAQAELLASKAEAASCLSKENNTDIQQLYSQALLDKQQSQRLQDEQYLSLLPTFLSLHQQATSSQALLGSLESFLSTFQSDLSALSTHISSLQTTSQQIDTRLEARRDVEVELAAFLSEIALSPRIVDLFFETDPESRPELWQKAVKQLEKVLEATKPGATLPSKLTGDRSGNEKANISDTQAVREVREVAESCKNVVAGKLRTYLTHPHSAIKASVTTNIQVLQTSILLRHHRPLYSFLARQLPRVAIDVQRSYVAAARLYFETAFRRYTRSLGVIRKRWIEPSQASSTSSALITDPPSSSAAGGVAALQASMSSLSKGIATASGAGAAAMAFLSRPGGSSTPSTAIGALRTAGQDASGGTTFSDNDAMSATSDPWIIHASRLHYSKYEGPGTVLGYMADDSSFKACPENLFRSASLVMLDNACSEYTFLVRFFENLVGDESDPSSLSTTTKKGRDGSTSSTANGQGPVLGPEESASVAGDETADESVTTEMEQDPEPEPGVVQLSRAEQAQMKGRGASDEIFKQIMEPAITTWTTFVKGLLSPTPPFLSLLSMVHLNDTLLQVLKVRGCETPLIESALMGFKIQAYPLLKRQLDEQIQALVKLNGGSSSSGAASAAASGMGSMFKALSGAAAGFTGGVAGGPTSVNDELAQTIGVRYASLFTKMIYVLEDDSDDGLFANIVRLRQELEKLITSNPNITNKSKALDIVLHSIETGAPSTTHPRVQNELSFWNEAVRRLRSNHQR